MNVLATVGAPWIFASCFGLSIVSALFPWLNGEVIVLSLAALLASPLELIALALVASAGQMVGKCVLYWIGGRAAHATGAGNARVERWRARLQRGRLRSLALVFVSSATGIPPLYLTTLVAGAVQMAFPRFLGAAACGRLVRFGVLVFCPQVVLHLLR